MKYKKGLLVLCIIICLFSIASVAANDMNDTVLASDNDLIENDALCSSDAPKLGANPDGTFMDLCDEIENTNGELNLTRNYAFDVDEDDYYGIIINKPLTINGNGFSISGRYGEWINFDVNSPVTFNNISFSKVNVEIYSDHNVLNNCNFTDDSHIQFFRSSNNNIVSHNNIISGCNFVGCVESECYNFFGLSGYDNIISNCNIEACGDFSIEGFNNVITGCTFDNNDLNDIGYCSFLGSDYVIEDCSFLRYRVGCNGSNNAIESCSFRKCSSGADGGALYLAGANATLDNCSFVDCSSEGNGGAVYSDGSDSTVSDCSFVNCTAVTGGGIYFKGEGCSLINPIFKGNSAQNFSDWYSENYLVIPDGTFTDLANYIADATGELNLCRNYAYDADVDDNNGIVIDKPLTINGNGHFINGDDINRAFTINSPVTLNDISFVNANVELNTNDNVLNNCNFTDYSSSSESVVFCVGSNNVLNDCNFVDCTIDDSAFIVYCRGSDNVLNDCSFVNCNCVEEVIFFYQSNNNTITGCSFDNNDLNEVGYCSFLGSGYVIADCSFVKFKISCSGSNNNIERCSFSNCSSGADGGAIELGGINVTLNKCSFVNCSSDGNGGAVHCHASNVIVIKSSFMDCSAENYGGGIYFDGENCRLIDSTFNGNVATNGSDWYSVYPFNDSKISTVVTAHDVTMNYADSSLMIITLTDCYGNKLAGENLLILLNDDYKTELTDDNGQVSITIPKLTPSNYTATVSYDGSDYYNSCNATVNIVVNKADTQILVEDLYFVYNDTVEVTATIKNVYGKALKVNGVIQFNGQEYQWKSDSRGNINLSLGTFAPGTYVTTISYAGNVNYNPSSTLFNVVVDRKNVTISASDVSLPFKDPTGTLNAVITTVDGKPLSVYLNVMIFSKDYSVRANSEGEISLPIGALTPGSYWGTISFDGDENYNPYSTHVSVYVTKANTQISAPDVTVSYKDSRCELIATITNAYGKALGVSLNVMLNGKNYVVKADSNGQIVIPTNTLDIGRYAAIISYRGNINYNPATTTAKITVTKANTIMTALNTSVAYKNTTKKTIATLTDAYGKGRAVYVNVTLNGETFAVRANYWGEISVSTANLAPGTYDVTVSYKGNGNYYGSTATAQITVEKAETIITAPDISVAYKDVDGELVATLTNAYGKPLSVYVTVELNGVSYDVRADSNGQIHIPTKSLAPGTYAATITYNGNGNYNPTSTTAQITVTKADTVITAPDVTVKSGDPNGKLVATLTNAYGKALSVYVTVDIDGVSYDVRADSNGQINIPTAELASGTHTATITYNGNGNYNPTSTTANIVVKP